VVFAAGIWKLETNICFFLRMGEPVQFGVDAWSDATLKASQYLYVDG
jgi:hypothetical protein